LSGFAARYPTYNVLQKNKIGVANRSDKETYPLKQPFHKEILKKMAYCAARAAIQFLFEQFLLDTIFAR